MNNKIFRTILVMALCLICSAATLKAQQPAAAPFPLPEVPEALTNFNDRVDYLVEHYWDRANLKKKFSNNKAMGDVFASYLDLLPHASRKVTFKSIDEMMEQLKKNPIGAEVIVDRAIDELYGDSAMYHSDEVLLRILKRAMNVKKLNKDKMAKYTDMVTRIASCMQNGHVPMVDVTLPDGSTANLSNFVDNDSTSLKVLFLIDPDDSRFTLDRVRLAADSRLNNLIADGVFKMISVYPNPADEKWLAAVPSLPAEWTNLAVPEGDARFDLRVYPCIYVLDTNGFIRYKNLTVAQFLDWIYSL